MALSGAPDFNDPIRRLQDQIAINQRDLEYRLDVMGMKRTWQESQEENLDDQNPIFLDIYIPPDTKLVNRAFLRLRLKAFRAYSRATGVFSFGPLETSYTDDASWDLDAGYGIPDVMSLEGTHDHGGVVSPDGGHAHGLAPHKHSFTLPDHQHEIEYGIFIGTIARNVTVKINGTDRTAELGGPFNTDQPSLDIAKYLMPIGWNTVEIASATLGRVHATLFVELYLP